MFSPVVETTILKKIPSRRILQQGCFRARGNLQFGFLRRRSLNVQPLHAPRIQIASQRYPRRHCAKPALAFILNSALERNLPAHLCDVHCDVTPARRTRRFNAHPQRRLRCEGRRHPRRRHPRRRSRSRIISLETTSCRCTSTSCLKEHCSFKHDVQRHNFMSLYVVLERTNDSTGAAAALSRAE